MPSTSDTSEPFTSSASALTGTAPQPSINTGNMVILTSPSLTEIVQSIEKIKDTHFSPPRPQKPRMSYLLVEELDRETFDRIWHDSNLLKAVTATLWRANRTILFRIMPNRQHEGLRSSFDEILLRVLLAMHLEPMTHGFRCFRSARVYGDQTAKEPDCSFYPPASLGPGITPSPSLVLEVGVSESYSRILQDAQWWHTNAPTRPGLMVLMHTTRSPRFRVDIEIWTHICNQCGSRKSAPSHLQKSQHLYVQGNAVYGGPLRLDFELLMRRPPNPLTERDAVMTDQQVLYIATQME